MGSLFAHHIRGECWRILGHGYSLAYHAWVEYDKELCVDNTVTVGVQVNGKQRGEIVVGRNTSQEEALAEAIKQPKVKV